MKQRKVPRRTIYMEPGRPGCIKKSIKKQKAGETIEFKIQDPVKAEHEELHLRF